MYYETNLSQYVILLLLKVVSRFNI